MVKCEVVGVRDFGLVVKIDGRVQAVLPSLHLSTGGASGTDKGKGKGKGGGGAGPTTARDGTALKAYKTGQTMTCRVWSCTGNAIIVTAKKQVSGLYTLP